MSYRHPFNRRKLMKMKHFTVMLVMLSASYAQVTVGEQAPTFFLPLESGESFYMSRVIGPKARVDEQRQAIVISFFATWCIPCKKEIPQLEILQKEFPNAGFYLVGVNEAKSLLSAYIAEFDVKLPVLVDRYGVVAKKYGVVDEQGVGNLPTLYIIGADGQVAYHHVGYKEGDEKIYAGILGDLIPE